MPFTTTYLWTTDDDKHWPQVSVELEVSYKVTKERGPGMDGRYTVTDVAIEGIGDVLVWFQGFSARVEGTLDLDFERHLERWLKYQFAIGESNGTGLYEAVYSHCVADYERQLSYAE